MILGINFNEIFAANCDNLRILDRRNGGSRTVTRHTLLRYHDVGRMGVIDYTKGVKTSDIKTMSKADKVNVMVSDNGHFESKFGIGFEVEKNSIPSKISTPLFAGYEADSSCGEERWSGGEEAVTNIIPLVGKGTLRNKVNNMVYEARDIINDNISPSNHRCGGHITLSCKGLDGAELFKAVRPLMGIVYALFRKRLINGYCNKNLRLAVDFRYDLDTRYCSVLQKEKLIEIRLVSRFENTKQVMRRYELMYELLNFAVNNPNGKFSSFLKIVKPIITRMYGGDEGKVNEIISLSKSFKKYIDDGIISEDIAGYVT